MITAKLGLGILAAVGFLTALVIATGGEPRPALFLAAISAFGLLPMLD